MAKKKEIQEQIIEQNSDQINFSQLVKVLKKTTDHQTVKIGNQIGQPPFWLSTGDDILDIYISNRKHGGVAGGRITSFNGLPQSGKSLVCAHLIKSCQQRGGIPVYIDTEGATSTGFWKAIGIDLDRVIVYNKLEKVETIHKITEQLMYSVKLTMPDKPLLIIVDSLTAAKTQAQLQNKQYQNKGYLAALKARMNSEALGKLAMMASIQNVALVYTAQVRAKMEVANKYMDPYGASSGGMALTFYASTDVRFAKKSKLKEDIYGVETVVGVRTKARIDKSRLGPTNRQCQFDVYYDCGIDNYSNWLQTLKKYKVIQGKGTKNLPWTIKFEGKQIIIPGKFNTAIRQDEKLREQVYDVLAQLLILKYKTLEQAEGRQIFVQDEIQEQIEPRIDQGYEDQ